MEDHLTEYKEKKNADHFQKTHKIRKLLKQ